MPRKRTRQKKRHRGYRKFFTRPPKGRPRLTKRARAKESCLQPEQLTTQSTRDCTLGSEAQAVEDLLGFETIPDNRECDKLPFVATAGTVIDEGAISPDVQHQGDSSAEVDESGCFLGFDLQLEGLLSQERIMLQKHGIRVLALFDGLATGLVVLEKLRIQVDAYFSCEIDPGAIAVQQHHHYGKIVELGSVTEVTPHCLQLMGRIDLVIGGSPCEDISLANTTNRKGINGKVRTWVNTWDFHTSGFMNKFFADANSTGWLMFEYQRILKLLQDHRPADEEPLLWLYENVYPMEHHVLNSINTALECDPVMICASAFVPMRRRRNFWGNIPLLHDCGKSLTKTKLVLQDFLKPFRMANVEQLPTLTTTSHSQLSGPRKKFPVIEKGVAGYLHLYEIELLFGFPMQYTAVSNLSFTKRRQLLGRAWCVPVIEYILKPLIKIFKASRSV